MGEVSNPKNILFTSVLIVMCVFGLPAQAKYGGGTGEPNDPYLIYTAEQMNEIGLSGNSDDWDKHFKLMADIDLSGYTGTSFNIIGSYSTWIPFTGVFDGDNHRIFNFTYESNDIDYVGLFRCIQGTNAEIKNLGLIKSNIDAGTGSRVGSLVGRLYEGTISGCYVNGGSVSGNNYVGGLVGTKGIAVFPPPPIPPPLTHVINCYAIVDVEGQGDYIGGLIGDQYKGTISNCFAAGNTFSSGNAVGGLVGLHTMGSIYNSYAGGTILGTNKVGGLVGENLSDITNCYATGSVSGTTEVGGLLGNNSSNKIVSNCYSAGSVEGANDVGGLIGTNEYGTVMSSFWDIETSGLNNMCGGQGPDGSGCENANGKTTGQMQTESTFTDAGWDFVGETANGTEDIWKILEGQDYPRLSWQICGIYGKYGGGNGTPEDPYQIFDANQMNAIGADSNDWDKHFRLMADIDLGGYTGTSYNIIGNATTKFTGVFDGNDHTISNFTYESNDISNIGLFGYVSGVNISMKDVELINPNIDAGTGNRVGSLVGWLVKGTMSGCYVNGGSVSGSNYVGGLVGTIGFESPPPHPFTLVTNCGAIVDVTGYGDYIGGLIGDHYRGTISDCYAAGNTLSSGNAVGGLAGLHSNGSVYNSYATGTILGIHRVGGLVGDNFSGVTNCYSTGGVEGENSVGGLAGYNASVITECYSTGSVEGENNVGGLVGNNYYSGRIGNCYSAGSVRGTMSVAGLVGANGNSSSRTATVSNCYSTSSVVGANDVGGLVGINEYGIVMSSFWDIETSGLNNMCGGQGPDGSGCDNANGKTTGQMQTESTFTDAGWDFVGETANGTDDIWKICEGQDYPRLWWEIWVPCTKYGGGTGEPDDPYLIYNAIQMNAIGANPDDRDKHFKLMNNIDLSEYTGTEFNIIGRSLAEAFLGTFNGNGHTISNFSYNSDDIHRDLVGIFGYVNSPDALVSDLVLINPNIETDGIDIGSLIGYLSTGTVKDCYVKGGRVSGGAQVGGLVGDIYKGAISNCGSINCTVISQEGWIGGLVGVISSSSGPTMSNCFSQGGSVTGRSSSGGLLGVNFGAPISYSYSTTNVYGIYLEGHYGIGGLVGYSQIETISDCYATGDVQGYGTEVGGLVGFLQGGMVSRCYSSGKVSGSGTLGGLIGDNNVGNGEVAVSFWDNQTSLQKISAGGTGLPTAEMQSESTFTDAGWDFVTRIWKMCDGPYYPRLWWEICPVRPVYYVDADADGANDGSSWANAFTELEYALFIARYGDEFHVAQGTYKPIPNTQPPPPPIGESNYSDTTVTDSNRTATFQLINGVTIKGGYAGLGEPDPDARDIHLYETILSGDLDGNDVPGLDPCDLINHPSRAENSYHVVTGSGCDESAVLDGFTITGGNANGSHQNYYDGGGIYNDNGSPILLNCTLASNSAKYDGGGIHSSGGNPQLTNCLFSGNWAGDDAGGIYNDGGNPALTNCLFSGNRAGEDAGMIYNVCGSPKLTNCTFYANSAGGNTGGIFTINPPAVPPPPPAPIITNCILWGNRDRTGTTQAAQISWQAGDPLVNFCCIQGWTGTLGGTGNIGADPCFADANNGDCHLKSEAGRWDANSQTWIKDDVNSPCIDAGDPNYDWRGELWPHGKRINMGAYGGTPEASMSLSDAANIADLNLDGLLCYLDMKLLIDKWLCETALQAEDLSRDGFVNFTDFAIFAHHFELPARNPNPDDGATGVDINDDLSWTAGSYATSHDVYFGTSNPPPFIHNQPDTIYDPGTMDYSTTYFWRIDESNQWGTATGPVWSFTTIMSPPP